MSVIKKIFCKFICLINDKWGTHSVYTMPVYTGTIDTETLFDEAFEKTSYESSVAVGMFREIKKTVMKYLLKGYRVDLGEYFLTLYPTPDFSMKDYRDDKGNLIVVDESMVKPKDIKSRIGCTVHKFFSDEFAKTVVWKKVKDGIVQEEDDATQLNNGENNQTPVDTSTGTTVDTSTGSNTGGNDIPAGNG